jgi:hypothetical protein
LSCTLANKSSAYPVAASLIALAVWRLRRPASRREAFKQCAIAMVALATAAVLPI